MFPVHETLLALARAVALDGSLGLEWGKPGCGWAYLPERHLIVGDPQEVEGLPLDVAQALVAHEAGHAAITRYHHFVAAGETPAGLKSLLNALEDCRMEAWLTERYPGLGRWLEEAFLTIAKRPGCELPCQPRFVQFCMGLILEWRQGALPPGLRPEVIQALEATRQARQRVVASRPPRSRSVSPLLVASYPSSPAAAFFSVADRKQTPTPFEQAVRLTAYEAYSITVEEVWPLVKDLVEQDEREGWDVQALEKEFLAQLHSPLEEGKGIPLPAEDSQRLPSRETYRSALQKVHPLIERLVEELEAVLRAEARPRWAPGFPSGMRVDLRQAMAFEADPRNYHRLWERRTIPVKRDPAFLLLVDLSGSMSKGQRIEQAFRGVVLLAETLERLRFRYAIHGFQDVLIPFKAFSAPLDAAMRNRLAEMVLETRDKRPHGRNCSRYNDDGPCLREAAQELLTVPATERFLIVLSDGLPEGPQGTEASCRLLREAVDWVRSSTDIHLIGLGLGPSTEHVEDFYPYGQANVPLEQVPVVLGRLLRQLILTKP